MSSLSLPGFAHGWRRLAHQAVSWWLAELAALMPERVRRLLALSQSDNLVMRFGLDEATLAETGRGHAGPVVIPIRSASEASTLWIKHHFAGSAVRIVLHDDVLLRCAIELPIAAEANMAQILAHQLERLVPLDPNTLAFVWSIVERRPRRNAIGVAVTIVRKTTLEQAAALAQRVGLAPSLILVPQGTGPAQPVWRVRAVDRTRRRLHRVLEAAAVSLVLAAYAVHVVRLDAQRDALRAQLTIAQAQLPAVAQQSQLLAAMRSTLAAIKARLAAPTPLAILDELTRRLPLDASLSAFSYRPDRVEMTGTASHATALLGALTSSPAFDDPQFGSPITAAPDGTGEHFELSVRLHHLKP